MNALILEPVGFHVIPYPPKDGVARAAEDRTAIILEAIRVRDLAVSMQLNRRQQREQSRQTESESLLAVRPSVHWTVKVIRPSRSSDRSSPISAVSADSCSSLNCYGLARTPLMKTQLEPQPYSHWGLNE